MGLFLLVFFVSASLAFALRAWASYNENRHSTENDSGEGETPLVIALAAVTILSPFVAEILRNSFRMSFIQAGLVTLGVTAAGQWMAFRFFGKKRAET